MSRDPRRESPSRLPGKASAGRQEPGQQWPDQSRPTQERPVQTQPSQPRTVRPRKVGSLPRVMEGFRRSLEHRFGPIPRATQKPTDDMDSESDSDAPVDIFEGVDVEKALHKAIAKNDINQVKKLLDYGTNPNAYDENGVAPLHKASKLGLDKIVFRLIQRGADTMIRDGKDATPLHWAAANNQSYICRLLWLNGAELEALDHEDRTPLHYAAHYGQRDAVKMLLKLGAKTMPQDEKEDTPYDLTWSSFSFDPKHIPTGEHLTRRQKEDEEFLKGKDAEKVKPLDKKQKAKLAHMALMEALRAGDKPEVQRLLDAGASPLNAKGVAVLHIAAKEGRVDLIDKLIDLGLDVNLPDIDQGTPLHWAAAHGQVEAVKRLLHHGAVVDSRDKNKRTPLHDAAEHGQDEVAYVLMNAGADRRAEACDGTTPLDLVKKTAHPYDRDDEEDEDEDEEDEADGTEGTEAEGAGSEAGPEAAAEVIAEPERRVVVERVPITENLLSAAKRNDVAAIKEALNRRADCNFLSSEGLSALHYAARYGHTDIADHLLKYGANPNIRDRLQGTPLHWAAHNGHLPVAKLLIKHGAKVDSRDGYETTPLHNASARGQAEMIKFLVQSGASLDVEDDLGRTPVDVARDKPIRRLLQRISIVK